MIATISGCATGKFTLQSAQSAAARGNANAEYFLAKCYAKGEGVPPDRKKAAEYMRRAAEHGSVYAQDTLGVYYVRGWGVPRDPARAVVWFRKAAEHGDPLAEYSLGLSYAEGRGVPRDTHESLRWYRRAAEQGQPDAAGALGDFYLSGSAGIPPNYREAFEWYQKGAKRNNAVCLNGLGFMYQRGLGTARNPARALKCYRRAAERGFVRAYANLGQLYLDGSLIKPDFVEAYKWFLLGANQGDGVALHYVEEMDLKQLLSQNQKAEAYARVRDYQESQPRPGRGGMSREPME